MHCRDSAGHLERREALPSGASIAATAAPAFAVFAGIAASSTNLPQPIGLLLLHNVAFVVPLLAIVAAMVLTRRRADRWLQRSRAWLQRSLAGGAREPLMFVGGALAILGGSGLVRQ